MRWTVSSRPVGTSLTRQLHQERRDLQTKADAAAELQVRERFGWLMGSATGRAFWLDLIDASRVLERDISNTTATTQSGIVAVRNFAMQHLLEPVLEHCPELFLQARAEHDRSTAERAPNTN